MICCGFCRMYSSMWPWVRTPVCLITPGNSGIHICYYLVVCYCFSYCCETSNRQAGQFTCTLLCLLFESFGIGGGADACCIASTDSSLVKFIINLALTLAFTCGFGCSFSFLYSCKSCGGSSWGAWSCDASPLLLTLFSMVHIFCWLFQSCFLYNACEYFET